MKFHMLIIQLIVFLSLNTTFSGDFEGDLVFEIFGILFMLFSTLGILLITTVVVFFFSSSSGGEGRFVLPAALEVPS